MAIIDRIRNFYGRFEWPISSISLVAGFIFDALTLRRADTFFENFWIIGHLVIIMLFIVLIHLKESDDGDEKNPRKAYFWYVNILQFFFGGILSAFIVFYFRSTDIWNTWPFVLILFLAFMANESLKRHYVRFSFQVSLFFLSVYSLAIFLMPVILHSIGVRIFLISGALSLSMAAMFIAIIFSFSKRRKKESLGLTISMVMGIYVLVNLLYFTNLIPPIPLSLRDAGVYHSVEKRSDGLYLVTYEDQGPFGYFKFYEDYHEYAGTPVYAYSAVFSPVGLNLNIIHEWQHYDPQTKTWQTLASIPLTVIGGRDGGFQTYSMLYNNILPGHWRVNIKTTDGKVIGQMRLNIIAAFGPPVLYGGIK